MTDQAAQHAPFYKNPDYLLLVSAQGLSLAGREIETIVLPLLVLGLTGSAAQVGMIAAMQALPYLLFSLAAGALIDRWDRRYVMLAADLVRVLAFASLPVAWMFGVLHIAQLYVTAALSGTAFVFYNIAEISGLPQIVQNDELTRATSANTVVEWIAGNIGPALGGVLVGLRRNAVTGAMVAYAVQAAMLFISLFFLLGIRTPLRAPPVEAKALGHEIREGIAWLMGHRTIRTLAFVTILISTVFGPVQLALIVLARNTYHASPAAIGLIFSLAGGAGLLTTLFAPWTRRTFHVGHILITGMTLWAVGLLMMAAGPTLIFAAAGWMFISAVAGIQDVINVSYRLSLIPPNLQARVNSVYRFLVWGIRPAAIAGGGFLVASIGPRPLLWICAAGMMLTAMIAFLSPIRAAR